MQTKLRPVVYRWFEERTDRKYNSNLSNKQLLKDVVEQNESSPSHSLRDKERRSASSSDGNVASLNETPVVEEESNVASRSAEPSDKATQEPEDHKGRALPVISNLAPPTKLRSAVYRWLHEITRRKYSRPSNKHLLKDALDEDEGSRPPSRCDKERNSTSSSDGSVASSRATPVVEEEVNVTAMPSESSDKTTTQPEEHKEGDAVPAKHRPHIIHRWFHEIIARCKYSSMFKKDLLKDEVDENECSGPHSLHNKERKSTYSSEVSVLSKRATPEAEEEANAAPRPAESSETGKKPQVHKEGKMSGKHEDEKKGKEEDDDKQKDENVAGRVLVAVLEDQEILADEEEDEEVNGVHGSITGPGSPSFRVYCVQSTEDTKEDGKHS